MWRRAWHRRHFCLHIFIPGKINVILSIVHREVPSLGSLGAGVVAWRGQGAGGR